MSLMQCTSAYKKSVSSVRMREVTACYTSASVASRLPIGRFLKGLGRWKSFRQRTANQAWDVPALQLWSVGPASFPSLWAPSEGSIW